MAVDVAAVLFLLDQLRQWLGAWIAIRKDVSERESQAVRLLLTALTKTQVYLGSLEHGDKPDRHREEELAMAWSEAAAAFAGIDADVAPLLQLKSEAWARPELWSAARVREAGITIEAVAKLARGYLARPRN